LDDFAAPLAAAKAQRDPKAAYTPKRFWKLRGFLAEP
jgi:hypothetical protein